jgi:hypothetical protein
VRPADGRVEVEGGRLDEGYGRTGAACRRARMCESGLGAWESWGSLEISEEGARGVSWGPSGTRRDVVNKCMGNDA